MEHRAKQLTTLALDRAQINLAQMLVDQLPDERDNLSGALQEAITGRPGERLRAYLMEAVETWMEEAQYSLCRRADQISEAVEATYQARHARKPAPEPALAAAGGK